MKKLLPLLLVLLLITGCSINSRNIKSPNYLVNFDRNDFVFSPQVESEAQITRILGIDWSRLFGWNNATIDSDLYFNNQGEGPSVSVAGDEFAFSVGNILATVPIIGYLPKGQATSYALYELISQNPGYDVIVYPQYEMQKRGIPFFYMKTRVKVRARLARVE
ncbi:MAG: hypothetical protein ACNS62_19045 [Candidatus Cyclobacteriaceae bacterium M3_2C_046]